MTAEHSAPDAPRDLVARAQAEAENRWGAAAIEAVPSEGRTPQQWLDLGMAAGFVLGAQWADAEPDVGPIAPVIPDGLCGVGGCVRTPHDRFAPHSWGRGPDRG